MKMHKWTFQAFFKQKGNLTILRIIIKNEVILGIINKCLLQILGLFFRKNETIWVFGEGYGKRFFNNSKHFFLFVFKNYKNIHPIWLTKKKEIINQIREIGQEAYKINSLKALYYGLIAKVYIHGNGRDDIINYSIKNAIFVNLYHGMVLKKLKISYRMDDLDIASSELTKDVRCQIFPNMKKLVITGEPRYDVLFEKTTRFDILKKYNLEQYAERKIVSYLPTTRIRWEKEYKPFFKNFDKISELKDIVIFEKSHPSEYESAREYKPEFNNIINLTRLKEIDQQDILTVTDILITDYSSCFVDFLLTERPIIFYAYDYEKYSKLQGFYYDYNEITPGIKAYNEDEVFDAIKKYFENPDFDKDKRIKAKNMFHKYQDGNCSERVYQEIIKLLNKEKK